MTLFLAIGGALLFLIVLAWWRGRTPAGESGTAPEVDDDGGFGALLETVVLLPGNRWDACEIDGLREPWSRFTSKPTQGLGLVPAGRHRVVTETPSGPARLDFVLYPGEIFARELDVERGTWKVLDEESERTARERARGGMRGPLAESLLSYKTTLGMARLAQGSVRSPQRVVDDVLRGLEDLVERARDGEERAKLLAEAEALGEPLVGVPLSVTQLRSIASPLGEKVKELAASDKKAEAESLARIGLAVLPGEASLLDRLGEL